MSNLKLIEANTPEEDDVEKKYSSLAKKKPNRSQQQTAKSQQTKQPNQQQQKPTQLEAQKPAKTVLTPDSTNESSMPDLWNIGFGKKDEKSELKDKKDQPNQQGGRGRGRGGRGRGRQIPEEFGIEQPKRKPQGPQKIPNANAFPELGTESIIFADAEKSVEQQTKIETETPKEEKSTPQVLSEVQPSTPSQSEPVTSEQTPEQTTSDEQTTNTDESTVETTTPTTATTATTTSEVTPETTQTTTETEKYQYHVEIKVGSGKDLCKTLPTQDYDIDVQSSEGLLKLVVASQQQCTKMAKLIGLSPVWDETFVFGVEDPETEKVKATFYLGEMQLGRAIEFKLSDLGLNQPTTRSVPVFGGEIDVSFCAMDFGQTEKAQQEKLNFEEIF